MTARAIIIPSEDFDRLTRFGGSCLRVPILDGDGFVTGGRLTIPAEDDDEGYAHVQIEVGGGVIDVKADCIGLELDSVDERGLIPFPTLEVCLDYETLMTIRPDDYQERLNRVLFGDDYSEDDLGDLMADRAQSIAERALDDYLSSIE